MIILYWRRRRSWPSWGSSERSSGKSHNNYVSTIVAIRKSWNVNWVNVLSTLLTSLLKSTWSVWLTSWGSFRVVGSSLTSWPHFLNLAVSTRQISYAILRSLLSSLMNQPWRTPSSCHSTSSWTSKNRLYQETWFNYSMHLFRYVCTNIEITDQLTRCKQSPPR